MQDEAEITISGTKLANAESMTVRVAIDTLANVLAAGVGEQDADEVTALYRQSLRNIQALIESREPRRQ
jgi:hypothetical protein